MIWNSFLECCSTILKSLPPPELPFIPALIIGSGISLTIIVFLYRRHHGISVWASLKKFVEDLFFTVPETEHSEFMKCNIESCVRCKKSEELKSSVIDQWKHLNIPNKEEKFFKIAQSIKTLSARVNQLDNDENTNLNQKPTIFEMDLSQNPIWTDLDCFYIEKELLKLNFKVISEEFSKLLEAFHKGNYQGWKLNYIPEGHWCIFPLVDQGTVNDDNCEKCPNTAALLGSFPSLMKDCVFGNACFSLIFPDSQIEPHYGPTNLRLRCHYGKQILNFITIFFFKRLC